MLFIFHRFKLLFKLIVLMGVTWTFEFILWMQTGDNFSWIVIAVDVLNILQAVATFIIFVCKRKIINQLEQKHPVLRGTQLVFFSFYEMANI